MEVPSKCFSNMTDTIEDPIQFFSEDYDFSLQNEKKYSQWLHAIAKSHNVIIEQLNYIFSHDEYILSLNKQYLDHDYYTDILSFPSQSNPIQGDIFISVERVNDNALQLGINVQEELLRVMAHGLLHFIGFDDHEEKDVAEMRKQEAKAMHLFDKQ